jgi:hypothetical protein
MLFAITKAPVGGCQRRMRQPARALPQGPNGRDIRTPESVREIVKIVVIGVVMNGGIGPSVPMERFTLFPKEREDA